MAKERINVSNAETFGLLFEDFCNMNDTVAIVLTAHGARLLNAYHKSVNERIARLRNIEKCATDYKEGDVFEGQLWCIFGCFNDYNWYMGVDAPFTRILKRK